MNANFEYYKVFYYVAKYNSISQAANALHLTQPTVTHHIKALEIVLGVSLFNRSSKGVTMTHNAEIIWKNIEHAIEHIYKAESALESYKSLDSGTLYIITTETSFYSALMPVVSKFHQEYPLISINFSQDFSIPAIERLKDGLADLIVITDPLDSLDNNISVTPLFPINDIVVCGVRVKY